MKKLAILSIICLLLTACSAAVSASSENVTESVSTAAQSPESAASGAFEDVPIHISGGGYELTILDGWVYYSCYADDSDMTYCRISEDFGKNESILKEKLFTIEEE